MCEAPQLEKILEECRDNGDVKVIVFSEWERKRRSSCVTSAKRLKLGFAWHTGSVPQRRRRAEIKRLQVRPGLPRLPQHRQRQHRPQPAKCQRGHQLRPSLEPGAAGATDLPSLAQASDKAGHGHSSRFGRDHRTANDRDAQDQTGSGRKELSDLRGDLNKLALTSGRQTFLSRLQQLLGPSVSGPRSEGPKPLPGGSLSGIRSSCRGKIGRRPGSLRRKLSARGGSFRFVRRGGAEMQRSGRKACVSPPGSFREGPGTRWRL